MRIPLRQTFALAVIQDPLLVFNIARAYEELDDGRNAVHYFDKFVQDYAAAAISLARALEIRPSGQVALFNLGYCRQQLGDGAGALGH